MTPITYEQIAETASRSEFHARALSMLLHMQNGVERQRRIWQLRSEVEALASQLSQVRAALKTEEAEQKRDREMGEAMLNQLDRCPSPEEESAA